MYEYKPLPFKEVKTGWYNSILSMGGAPQAAQHWCTAGYRGRAIGKCHSITSVIISFHPITGKDNSPGCHRRAKGGCDWSRVALLPVLPQER